MLSLFRRADPDRDAAQALFRAISEQARRPEFYTRLGVPDTIDGRFDLLVLHAFLVMEALKASGKKGEVVGTHLATAIFASLDDALRELGVSDMGLSRRIKAMANAFYGRLSAYAAAVDAPEMLETLLRNLYRGEENARASAGLVSSYVLHSLECLRAGESAATVLKGTVMFAPLPEISAA